MRKVVRIVHDSGGVVCIITVELNIKDSAVSKTIERVLVSSVYSRISRDDVDPSSVVWLSRLITDLLPPPNVVRKFGHGIISYDSVFFSKSVVSKTF